MYSYVLFSGVSSSITVGTISEVHLEKGTKGLLPCDVKHDIPLSTVDWLKASLDSDPLIILANSSQGGWRKGSPGYENGIYDMESNFSLIFNHVDIKDNGIFFCRVADFSVPPDPYSNQTNVSVFGM